MRNRFHFFSFFGGGAGNVNGMFKEELEVTGILLIRPMAPGGPVRSVGGRGRMGGERKSE